MSSERYLTAINLDRQTVLGSRIRLAETFWRRLRGLMGVRVLAPGEGLLLPRCNAVHNLFPVLPEAIDVIFFDAQTSVVALVPGLQRWRISPIVRGAASALEVPAGTIAASRTTIGDRFLIVDSDRHVVSLETSEKGQPATVWHGRGRSARPEV